MLFLPPESSFLEQEICYIQILNGRCIAISMSSCLDSKWMHADLRLLILCGRMFFVLADWDWVQARARPLGCLRHFFFLSPLESIDEKYYSKTPHLMRFEPPTTYVNDLVLSDQPLG